jgi:hypothetical protein
MPRIFLGNFDFEHELALSNESSGGCTPSPGRSAQLPRSDFRADHAWVAIAGADDVILASGRIDRADFAQLAELGLPVAHFAEPPWRFEGGPNFALVPWGWARSMLEIARRHDCASDAPPLDVVRQVNSRVFRFELEQKWNIGLAGTTVVTSVEELEAIIRRHGNAPRGWLLKANFGMSGREALRGRGVIVDDNARNWAQKRLKRVGPIIFEPVVERLAEAGIQFEVPRAGPPELLGVTPLLVDRSGVYRGSRFAADAGKAGSWQPAVEVGRRVAQVVQSLGYFGPLGIDAMQYRDATGQTRLRALQDLNARYTMGRLALGFRRLLAPGWCGTWLHFSERHLAGRGLKEWLADRAGSFPKRARVVVASPQTIGTQVADHQVLLVLAPTPEIGRTCEAILFGSLGITMLMDGLSEFPAELSP